MTLFANPLGIYILSELEKHIEREESLMGGKYKTINDLLIAKKKIRNLDLDVFISGRSRHPLSDFVKNVIRTQTRLGL